MSEESVSSSLLARLSFVSECSFSNTFTSSECILFPSRLRSVSFKGPAKYSVSTVTK